MQTLHTYSGMPGVKRKKVRGVMRSSISGIMKALKTCRVCSDAGDHGGVMVYIDDNGDYRCMFNRYLQTVDSRCFRTKAQVYEWLKEWFPRQRMQS